MIYGARRLPPQHITIRVPWHDTGWTGRVCAAPSTNTACLTLSRIAAEKRADEDEDAGCAFGNLHAARLPPCVNERAGFMSDRDLVLRKEHPYRTSSQDTHGHFDTTQLRLEAYSAACVPFAWMLRKQVEGEENGDRGKAEALRLGYDPQCEPDLPFKTNWIQGKSNQLVMLDTFFGAIEPETSLCIFYAKRTPLSEDPRRVIVGMARVKGVGPSTEYAYSRPGLLKGVLWERCVRHSLRPGSDADGFLMPYHDLIEAAAGNPELDVAPCIAFAPEDSFEDYSYASEHIGDDGAIASLLACAAALHAAKERADVEVGAALRWIDAEVARLWVARGVHPGLGVALTAFGLDYGGLLAHEIVRTGAVQGELFDAFEFIDALVENPSLLPASEELGFGETYREKWKKLPSERRALLDLVARCDLSADQAERFYQPRSRDFVPETTDAELLANPYLAFERDEGAAHRISFAVIDRGVFPPSAVRDQCPLPEATRMTDGIDRRRVRALTCDLLERAASEGHTLLPYDWIEKAALGAPLEPRCATDGDVLAMNEEWLLETLAGAQTSAGRPALKLRRLHDAGGAISRAVTRRARGRRHEIDADWRKRVDDEFGAMPEDEEMRAVEERARIEKAAALEQLASSRFTALVGPAGSGKTTLLKMLCDLLEVDRSGVLLLAPTGKARVRLEEATERRGQGKTIAQLLVRLKRYDPESGRYLRGSDLPKEENFQTVIVDESSMLTEEQLAALLDALGGVRRLVLVGDPRQLPPIGAGRPFVDICRHLAPPEQPPVFPRLSNGYAELTVIGRQRGTGRGDVMLAQHFSGGALEADADSVWHALMGGELERVRTVRWSGADALHEALVAELVHALKLKGPGDELGFAKSIGGTEFNDGGRAFFWPMNEERNQAGAAMKAHDWQVLSPVRATPAGVDALNLAVQRTFRLDTRRWAERPYGSKIPMPMGPQGILWGDKVINLRNTGRRRTYPAQGAAFIANGDIGVVVGGYKTARMKHRPRHLEVEFASQLGVKFTYPSWEFGGDDGAPDLELAYALTVHKTQGSQFGTSFLVVPKNCRPLSRELLYTALTRHRDRLVILHEDDLSALRLYAHPSASEIARRMTDLFVAPEPIEVKSPSGPTFLDEHLIHRTSRGELLRSKAELAIAEKLIAMGLPYAYEQPLDLGGRQYFPDFTIEDDNAAVTYYWEHLGLLDNPAYRVRWEKKRAIYLAHGVRPFEEDRNGSGNADRVLIETSDGAGRGLDMSEIARIASAILA